MADHALVQLAAPTLLNNAEDIHGLSYLAIDGTWQTGGGPTGAVTTYFMCGHDSACSDGAALHTWTHTAPDFAGAQAGSLPCGGPLVDIFVCGSVTV